MSNTPTRVLEREHRRRTIAIQCVSRGERRAFHPVLCLALCLAGACAARPPTEVTRELSGEPTRGAFVPPYAYEMYLRGELHLQRGEPGRAVEALELALAAPELDPYVLSRLAFALHLAGEPERARARLAQAAELTDCAAELWLVRGRIAQDEGQPQAALSAYERALECRPGDPEAERARLDALVQLGAKGRVRALLAGGPEGAVPSDRARQAALRHAVQAKAREATRALLSDASMAPEGPWPLRARALSLLGQHEAAARAWLRAAPLEPSDLPDAARSFARAGFWDEALAAADAALAAAGDAGPPRAQHDATRPFALTPDAKASLERVRARALHAQGELAAALAALPARSQPTLAAWLQQVGCVGLAGEVARPRAQ